MLMMKAASLQIGFFTLLTGFLVAAEPSRADNDVFGHFEVRAYDTELPSHLNVSFSGSTVPISIERRDEPYQHLRVAFRVSPYLPGAWANNGFELSFSSEERSRQRIRLFSRHFQSRQTVEGNIVRAIIYAVGVRDRNVRASELSEEIQARCNNLAASLSTPQLIKMSEECQSLYSVARRILHPSDTLGLLAFKGWFDAAYNLWKRTDGVYVFDDRLFHEYEGVVRASLRGGAGTFSERNFLPSLNDVRGTEVGFKYNEAEALNDWNLHQAAIGLLCKARDEYVRFGLTPDKTPRITLENHIDYRIRDFGGQTNNCPAAIAFYQ